MAITLHYCVPALLLRLPQEATLDSVSVVQQASPNPASAPQAENAVNNIGTYQDLYAWACRCADKVTFADSFTGKMLAAGQGLRGYQR